MEVDADPIFIREGDVWTGAGISACLDLSLALIADDLGEAVALRVARQLVMYVKRPSGQSQFSVPLEQVATTRRIEDLRHHILRHLGEPLTVLDLAEFAHVSDRHLTRIFKSELGMTPYAYIESVRVEKARNELESTDATLERIASACGFGTTDTLVRAFRRTAGHDADGVPAAVQVVVRGVTSGRTGPDGGPSSGPLPTTDSRMAQLHLSVTFRCEQNA